MYYGISDSAQVSISQEVSYDESFDYLGPCWKPSINNVFVLTSTFDNMFAKVSAKVVEPVDKRILLSILLAGLKTLESTGIYHASVIELEKSVGFIADHEIPNSVGEVVGVTSYNHKFEYEINIKNPIVLNKKDTPIILIEDLPESDTVSISLELNLFGKKVKSSIGFSKETWMEDNHHCLAIAKNNLLSSFYEKNYDPILSSYKYEMSDLDSPPSKTFNWNSGGEDPRIRKLPGLDEIVTHPESGTKQSVKDIIIFLNDRSKWTREEIADWLDTLDLDLKFKVDIDE